MSLFSDGLSEESFFNFFSAVNYSDFSLVPHYFVARGLSKFHRAWSKMVWVKWSSLSLSFLDRSSLCTLGWSLTQDPLPQPLECWGYRHVPPHSTIICYLDKCEQKFIKKVTDMFSAHGCKTELFKKMCNVDITRDIQFQKSHNLGLKKKQARTDSSWSDEEKAAFWVCEPTCGRTPNPTQNAVGSPNSASWCIHHWLRFRETDEHRCEVVKIL
jgi:hypothetical protein